MANAGAEQFTIEVTDRGFRQDVELAMGTDPIAAIVELVTNADDSYTEIGHGKNGRIQILLKRRRNSPSLLTISDRARGMSQEELRNNIGRAGGRTSGFDKGKDVRGLLGRGAKDVVHFGTVTWTSVRDKQRTSLTIEHQNAATRSASLSQSERVPEAKNGTTVTLEIQKRFTVPMHDRLKRLLQSHYALRPILNDRRGRTVLLGRGDEADHEKSEKLVYHEPSGEVLAERVKVPIPGYPGEHITVTLSKAESSLHEGEPREYWRHSLLITSGRAAYEVFGGGRFNSEADRRHLFRLFGTADVPAISRLIRDYDDALEQGQTPPDDNPQHLLTRNRQGLVADHPFTKALQTALEDAIAPHIEQMRKEAEERRGVEMSAELKQRLAGVGRDLAKWLQQEADEATDGTGDGGDLPVRGVTIIPSIRRAEPMQTASMLVRYRPVADGPVATARIELESDIGEASSELLELEQRDGYFSKTLTLAGRPEGTLNIVTASVGDSFADAEVRWEFVEDEEIGSFQFEYATYQVRESAGRIVRVLAPLDLLRDDPLVEMNIETGAGEPGVQLLTRSSHFGEDSNRSMAAATFRVRGMRVDTKALLTARCGAEIAKAEVRVVARGASGLDFDYERAGADHRCRMDPDESKVWINEDHPVIKRYLRSADSERAGETSVEFRTMLAEMLCATVVRYGLMKKRVEPEDPSILLTAYQQKYEPLLRRINERLIQRSEISPQR